MVFMTPKPTVADLHDRVTALETQNAHQNKALDDMSKKLDSIYNALMVPQAGQDKSFVDRVGRVAVAYESGGIITGIVTRVAALIVAVGVIWAAVRNMPGAGQ